MTPSRPIDDHADPMAAGRPFVMPFRLTIRYPGNRSVLCYSESALAGDVLAVYRRLASNFGQRIELLDFRDGEGRPITAPELEAIAQCERLDRHEIAVHKRGASCNSGKP